jgi:tRNA uridine 5-carbamoylmethylation protein Kti12
VNWYKIAQGNKELILVRGLPGSGKSFLSNELAGKTGSIFASDDFFMEDGNYNFDLDKLPEAHAWNRDRVLNAIKQKVSPVIWDNTNITMDELKFTLPAIKLAEAEGYEVRIEQANTPWAFDIDELEKRNTHNVPREVIQSKLDKWVPDVSVEDIKNDYEINGPGIYG